MSLGGIVGTSIGSVLPSPRHVAAHAWRSRCRVVASPSCCAIRRRSARASTRASQAQGLLPGTTLYAQFIRDVQAIVDAGDPLNYVAAAAAQRPLSTSPRWWAARIPPPPLPRPGDPELRDAAADRGVHRRGASLPARRAGHRGAGSGYVNFIAGDHGSLLTPAASAPATVEMQTEAVDIHVVAGNPSRTRRVQPDHQRRPTRAVVPCGVTTLRLRPSKQGRSGNRAALFHSERDLSDEQAAILPRAHAREDQPAGILALLRSRESRARPQDRRRGARRARDAAADRGRRRRRHATRSSKSCARRCARKELDDVDTLIAALTDAITAILLPVAEAARISSAQALRAAGRRRERLGQDHHDRQARAALRRRAQAAWCSPPATPSAPPPSSSSASGRERAGADIIQQQAGADPGAVVFDAVQAARSRTRRRACIIDTAGRLHSQSHLMDELKKVQRVIQRVEPSAPHEVLLVLDANQGQNALTQATQFHEAVGVTGLVLTKLDGTAKGGIVIAIARKLGLPIRFIGVGEQAEDFGEFDARAFATALVSGNSAAWLIARRVRRRPRTARCRAHASWRARRRPRCRMRAPPAARRKCRTAGPRSRACRRSSRRVRDMPASWCMRWLAGVFEASVETAAGRSLACAPRPGSGSLNTCSASTSMRLEPGQHAGQIEQRRDELVQRTRRGTPWPRCSRRAVVHGVIQRPQPAAAVRAAMLHSSSRSPRAAAPAAARASSSRGAAARSGSRRRIDATPTSPRARSTRRRWAAASSGSASISRTAARVRRPRRRIQSNSSTAMATRRRC